MSPLRVTRRQFLSAVAGGTALTSMHAFSGSVESRTLSRHNFVTRPDLRPSVVQVRRRGRGTPPGLIMLTPAPATSFDHAAFPREAVQNGPLIVDDAGQPVWFAPTPNATVAALQVQRYRGEPVLTWFQGEIVFPPGYGRGEFVIADESYQPVATVRAGHGLLADLHEFVITPRGTALINAYHDIRRDLSGIGGPSDATVTEGVVQEIDIASGSVLFEWRSTEHVGESESMVAVPGGSNQPYDYFHINSVVEDGEHALLVSARNTHAVYQLDRATGAVNWRLHGKHSDFRMEPDAMFAWQHHARRQPDGTISLFDNGPSPSTRSARALVLNVDESARTARTVRSLPHPHDKASPSQGNTQLLDEGHVFVGWGALRSFSEFGPNGELLHHAGFVDRITSYRTFRQPWVGRPRDLPAVVGLFASGSTSVYASWNGATEVTDWRVLGGPEAGTLSPVTTVPRSGFETRVDIAGKPAHVAVEALDDQGAVLARSPVVAVSA